MEMNEHLSAVGDVKIFRLKDRRTGFLRGYLAYQYHFQEGEIRVGWSLRHNDDPLDRELGKKLAIKRMDDGELKFTTRDLFPFLNVPDEADKTFLEAYQNNALDALNSATGWDAPFRSIDALYEMVDNMSIRCIHHSVLRRMAVQTLQIMAPFQLDVVV